MERVNTMDQNQSADSTSAPVGHDEEMAAKYEESQQTGTKQEEQSSGEGEEKLLGKFNGVDDLAEAYKELEKRLGENSGESQDSSEETSNEKPSEDDKSDEEMSNEEAAEKAADANLDVQSMSDYYAQNGDLTDDHYEALEKAGIPKQFVDEYIQGVEAKASQVEQNVYNEVGGQEQYQEMVEWAKDNMSDEQKKTFNSQIDSNDMGQIKSAVQSLAYQYQQGNPKEPSLATDTTSGKSPGSSFESVAQLTEAMRDPRYSTDPAYRRDVEQKLARSNVI
jgi:hypothetical protein